MKICSKCNLEKPETNIFFKPSRRTGSLSARCRKCLNQYTIEWRRKNREHVRQTNGVRNKDWRSNTIKGSYGTYKHTVRKKATFNLTLEQFTEIVTKPCFYCGGFNDRGFNGIDRADSDIGYELFNCLPACTDCNYAKQSLSVDKFIDLCKTITHHHDIYENLYY